MRIGGLNMLAVLAAAIAIYAVGFVIYGLLIPADQWMAMTGMSESERELAMARMPFSVVMPIMTALFMALIFKWASVSGAVSGARWGIVIGLASAVPTMLYGWVYGGNSTDMTMIDVSHLLLGHLAAGAILGGWK